MLSYLLTFARLELHYKLNGKPITVTKITLVDRSKEIDYTQEVSESAEKDTQDYEDEVSQLKARIVELEEELAKLDRPPFKL